MTQMTMEREPALAKRPGVLGVHSLDQYVFSVPDLGVAAAFHRDFGLDVRENANSLALHTYNNPHAWGSIVEGPNKQLRHLSFGVYDEDMAAFAGRLQALNIKRVDAPPGAEDEGIWIRNPDGTPIQLRVAPKSSPVQKTVPLPKMLRPGQAAAPKNSEAGRVKPNRLSHVLFFTPDVDAAVKFYINVLGLRLSDRSGSDIAFLHGVHGSDHHLIAFARSDGPGIHHTSWDVDSFHHVGLGGKLMADKGHDRGWGLGRHVLGSNYFYYVRDPWGSHAEYSCDMDFVPANLDWPSADHAAEDAFYVWGPKPPPDWVVNYETKS